MTFEQELYNNFSIYLSRPFFMTFTGDVSGCFLSSDFIVFKSRIRRLCLCGNPVGAQRLSLHQTTRNVAIRLWLLVGFRLSPLTCPPFLCASTDVSGGSELRQ